MVALLLYLAVHFFDFNIRNCTWDCDHINCEYCCSGLDANANDTIIDLHKTMLSYTFKDQYNN